MVYIKTAAAAALILLACPALFGQPITTEERRKTVVELERTRDLLLTSLDGVSEANAAKKPAADRWSVLECVEHLALTESGIFAMMQANLKKPASSDEERAKTKGKSEALGMFMPDRSRRAAAPVEVAPKGMFKTLAEARAAFEAARKETISFVGSTDLPLHSHVTRHFAFGELDAYQWFVLMAGHVERHTKQVNEVKATF